MTRIGPFEPLAPEIRARSLKHTMANHSGDVWVFAYGSLMWDSGFHSAERRKATLSGYRRSFCVWSAHARGTPDNPGLSLGLLSDDGASCDGIALRLAEEGREQSLEALWQREMWTGIYNPAWVTLHSAAGRFTALTFVVDKQHPQYARDVSEACMVRHLVAAEGKYGTCRSYLRDTITALEKHGFSTEEFAGLYNAVMSAAPE